MSARPGADVEGRVALVMGAARVPVGRLGKTGDVAALRFFPLSAEASFITGAAYNIDGGIVPGLAG